MKQTKEQFVLNDEIPREISVIVFINGFETFSSSTLRISSKFGINSSIILNFLIERQLSLVMSYLTEIKPEHLTQIQLYGLIRVYISEMSQNFAFHIFFDLVLWKLYHFSWNFPLQKGHQACFLFVMFRDLFSWIFSSPKKAKKIEEPSSTQLFRFIALFNTKEEEDTIYLPILQIILLPTYIL
jgi:hypothetical protein